VIRRVLQFVPTLFGALFLLHYLTCLGIQLTGNPIRALFGDRKPPQYQLEAMTRAMGLDDPCLRRAGDPCVGLFGHRLAAMSRGDFGGDFRGRPVTDIIGDAAPYTVRLALLAFATEVVVGVGAGILAGARSGGRLDYAINASAVLLVSIPVFVFAFLVQLFFGVYLGRPLRESSWAPAWLGQLLTPAFKADSPTLSMLIPGVVLGVVGLATTTRLMRANLMENMRLDYVRTARAKGASGRRVIGVHVLRNSLIPVVTNLGITLGTLLGGALVVESIFNVPGIGREVQQALFRGEPSVVIGSVTVLVVCYLVVNLVVDILYAVIDPRIRYE
jgi:peptide/nickel transport system permease protein/oligopeptide transport system permease protein